MLELMLCYVGTPSGDRQLYMSNTAVPPCVLVSSHYRGVKTQLNTRAAG